MISTRKHLSRRTVLRGAGTAVALPLLDSMVPAHAALRTTAAQPAMRLGAIYVPMGVNMSMWTPKAEGPLRLSPILQTIAPFKEQMLVVSMLDSEGAVARPEDGGGAHSRVQPTWLTGVHIKKTDGPGFRAGTSMDQLAAQQVGEATQLPSLELALESVDLVGACEFGYTCAYTGTLAWRTPTAPLPMEVNPRNVFERLFGDADSTDPKARLARMARNRSILDGVLKDLDRLQRGIGPKDRAKVAEYLDSVRDLERRIGKAEEQAEQEMPVVEQPVGAPASYEEHGKLMFELLALAWQADLTRVSTFMIARELSARIYPEIGITEPHHPLSHHANDPEKLAKQAKLNMFHLGLFRTFLEKLRDTPDGDGSLLDHSMILYGSGMSNSDLHLPLEVPTLVVAGKDTGIRTDQHVRAAAKTPLANLQLALLDRMGCRVDAFGDSTGRLDVLAV